MINQYTKEKKILEVGDILDFYYEDIDFINRDKDYIPITYSFNRSFIKYRYNYGEGEYGTPNRKNSYYVNRNAVFECTIPL